MLNGNATVGTDSFRELIAGAAHPESPGPGGVAWAVGVRSRVPAFTRALFGDRGVVLAGTPLIDSYDSDLGSYERQRVHVDSISGRRYAGSRGDVASNRNVSVVGDAAIFGAAQTGPDGSLMTTGAAVRITGTTACFGGTSSLDPVGYEPPPVSDGSLDIAGTLGAVLLTGNRRYRHLRMTWGEVVVVGETTLYLDEGLRMSGQARIRVMEGATLKILSDGDVSIGGRGVVNQSRYAGKVQIFATGGKSVRLMATSDLHGVIYAPGSAVELCSAGSCFGAAVASRMSVTGTQDFHYDEKLERDAALTFAGCRVASWLRIGNGSIQGAGS